MNKEAIERTKARVKMSIKNRSRVIVAPGFYIDRIRLMNPNHSPVVYYTPEPNKSIIEFFGLAAFKAVIGVVILIACGLIFLFSSPAKADIYIKIGSGYKLVETDHIVRNNGEKVYFNTGGKISARIEIGKESGNWTYGVSHHSQWATGFPFNDRDEPQKTELFVDYKWSL
jgi:hypothetical protein